ncbi:FeMo cofactor biosynthesis protein NifB [Pontiella desulfatans]|uniref:FeMo cofactor biosynthesis protein NifB n=1 Tax=Pontiella desulfatans TaxID=2750659 RepID=A0A6C2U948_PONDE|nr:radical SAM protein [Pontiella desulfatans]VGO16031.1 FeMo cofactor biosynthesis protein NifB [Pontiella desulfatans]
MALDFSKHPCFNPDVKGKFGRVHLPVAPKCNIQCGYCNRKYDCVNESRPGVTSNVLSPGQALYYVNDLVESGKPISVVGIAGPGDPFANPEQTMETLRLIRKRHPDMLLCVSTNGLGVGPYIAELAALEVSHITITMNAIDPEIGAKVYSWVREDKKPLRGLEAAELLLQRQIQAMKAIKAHGITLKINTILIPGVNDEHLDAVASFAKSEGADLHNIIPLCPVEGTKFEDFEEPTPAQIHAARDIAGQYMPQMTHCQRCRADACGLLAEGTTQETLNLIEKAANAPINPDEERPYVAIATREGVLVSQHLGEAGNVHVYEQINGQTQPVEIRTLPTKGGGDERWAEVGSILQDCRAILVSGIGPKPTRILRDSGIKVVVMEGLIEEALERIYAGEEIRAPIRPTKCGEKCAGDGGGCG